MSNFFGGQFFGGGFFGAISPTGAAPSGKGDNEKRRGIFKPTGLPPIRRRKLGEAPSTEQRVAETQEIAAEIARGVVEAPAAEAPISTMTLAEIDFEIGVLLRKARTEEDDIRLLTMLAAAAAA